MAVLEIEGIEELLRFLAADLAQRLLHRQRRARVLCHGVGENFGVGSMDGENLSLVVAAFRRHGRLVPVLGESRSLKPCRHAKPRRCGKRASGESPGYRPHLMGLQRKNGYHGSVFGRTHGRRASGTALCMNKILSTTEHRPWPIPKSPWVMTQRWNDLLFAHWPLPASELTHLLPEALTVDTFDGSAWVGVVPFWMDQIRMRGLRRFPGPTVSRNSTCGLMCASGTPTSPAFTFSRSTRRTRLRFRRRVSSSGCRTTGRGWD